jgi:hypothetical protein
VLPEEMVDEANVVAFAAEVSCRLSEEFRVFATSSSIRSGFCA